MATGGEVQGHCPSSVASEDLDRLKCQPCLKDGNLHEAVGMCIDCQEYLCSQCFKIHTVPTPSRNHQLLDKEQMLQSQIRSSPKDICTEQCSLHEDETIKYYCTTHSLLGCTVCITLGHATCKGVQYIPHAAKDLINNEEYRQVENQLNSAIAAFEKVAENVQSSTEELQTSCNEALEKIRNYRIKVEKAFEKLEAKLVDQVNAIKSKELKELRTLSDKYQTALEELQAAQAKIEALQNSKQNCFLYAEMMRTNEKLKDMDAQIKEAAVDKSYRGRQIKFTPNQGTLDSLKNSDTFGMLSVSGYKAKFNKSKDTIVSVKHFNDIKIKTGTDNATCQITGLILLPDGRLVLADYSANSKIKTVNVHSGQVLAELKLFSSPWDAANINNNNIAVTLPAKKTLLFVTLGDNNPIIDRTLTMSGTCRGVDYRNDKLAVFFSGPQQVQVINLQGTVLYTISADTQGNTLFSNPYYLIYGNDDKTLYVSNWDTSVVCVKLDRTVVATYTDRDLQRPRQLNMDRNGNVYVCTYSSNQVHQISKECKKIQVLMNQADGLRSPYSICLSEEEDKLYVGMWGDNNVKVYTTERRSQRLNELSSDN